MHPSLRDPGSDRRVTLISPHFVIPAKAGIQRISRRYWIPACAGMTKGSGDKRKREMSGGDLSPDPLEYDLRILPSQIVR